MTHVAACSSCGRAIIWTTSPTGARLPLTAKPVTVYTLDESAEPPNALRRMLPLGSAPAYISHFVDCPNAAEHSKPKARR